jgi:hypothetical protein
MAESLTRLELTCIGKENQPRLGPRILFEDSGKSYHAKARQDSAAEHSTKANGLRGDERPRSIRRY